MGRAPGVHAVESKAFSAEVAAKLAAAARSARTAAPRLTGYWLTDGNIIYAARASHSLAIWLPDLENRLKDFDMAPAAIHQ